MVSIILPTYNEKDNIRRLLDEISRNISPVEKEYEIIVVDDNSSDGTAEVMHEAARENPSIKLIERPQRGLAGAIWVGLKASQGERIVVMDSDFNHPPEMVPELLRKSDGVDLVIGSRYIPGGGMKRGWLRFQLSRFYNVLIKTVLGLHTKDNLSGLLCFRKSLFLSLPDHSIFVGYGDYCIRLIHAVHRSGSKIKEIPVVYGTREAGQSKTRFLYHFITYTRTLLSLLIRPIKMEQS